MGMSLLEVCRVSKTYGSVAALQEVDFRVEAGEWVSIMGPSGSGKTTLLNLIGCLDRPSLGSIVIEGVNTSTLGERGLAVMRREKIGLVFQQFHLIPHLTALENVMLAQYYHSMPDEAEALEALRQVGLADRVHHLPSQLSGGEQQRVCIARALINSPALILADEPTGNLDEANEKLVMNLFVELHRQGHTIIMVTHDPEIGDMAQRKIVLEHGRVRAIEDLDRTRGRRELCPGLVEK